MSTVHIRLDHRNRSRTQVVVDGHDLTNAVSGITLKFGARPGGAPQLDLELLATDATTFDALHVQVRIDPSAMELLERSGWTPPPGVESVLIRDADGCPCQWIDVGGDLGTRETVLGRTVPTCPIHGVRRLIGYVWRNRKTGQEIFIDPGEVMVAYSTEAYDAVQA